MTTDELPPAEWEADCEIIEDYMPPFPDKNTRTTVVVRHKPSGMFLRHSKGPLQGHFWDCYGDNYMNRQLAEIALSLSPDPRVGGSRSKLTRVSGDDPRFNMAEPAYDPRKPAPG